MNRFSSSLAVNIGASAAASDVIKFGEFTMGFFHIPADASITTITWYSSDKEDGTYLAAYDEDGGAITQAVSAEKAYEIPTGLSGAVFLKAVGDAAESGATFVLKA